MHESLALKKSLRQIILQYKEKHPNLSIRAIAKKSGVNRYFLSKLLDEKDETASLDLNQVLILAKYITARDSITEAINASDNSIKDILRKVFTVDYEENKKVIESNLYDKLDLYDKNVYFVLVLATYGLGTKRKYIAKILGEMGEKVLGELLEQRILVEDQGRIKLRLGTDFTYDFKVMARRIPDYLSFYRLERSGKKENYIHVISQGVNKKALHKIHKIHLTAHKQVAKIIANKENLGDIPMFSFACMDRLIDKIEEDANS